MGSDPQSRDEPLMDLEEPVSVSLGSSSGFEVVGDEDFQSVEAVALSDVGPEEDEAQTKLVSSPFSAPPHHASVARQPSTPTRSERPKRKPTQPPPKDRRIGQVLSGRYRLEKLIGKGGMGRVYLATQFPLNRAVAVKILNPEFQRKDPQFVRRFFLEAATAARLSHPNTITVFDYGETDRKELYIAMEYLKGRPLSRALATEGPFTGDRTMHISLQIVRALREAHTKGIIHRDLKPGNIMLLEEGDDTDFAKVLDFGLVKLFRLEGDQGSLDLLTPSQQGDDLTRAGMFLGSPKYMSPEQIQAADLDPRTDIYSLGIIMYQMLVGRPPFRGSTSVEIIYKHVNQPVPRIHDLNPDADAPPELEDLVLKCLSKNRNDRYGSMAELRQALRDVRRMVTGIASTTGSGLSSELTGMRRDHTDPSVSAQTPGSLSGSLPPVIVSAPPPGREAAFTDPSLIAERPHDTGPHVSPNPSVISNGPPQSALMRAAPYIAGISLVLVLGVLAYVVASAPPQQPGIAPPSTATTQPPRKIEPTVPAKLTARITLDSDPDGAAVTEGGRLLGVTPFEHEFDRGGSHPPRRKFVFTKTGFLDEVVEEKIDSDRLRIRANLRAEPDPDDERAKPIRRRPVRRPTKTKASDEPPTSDYKDNPY